MGQKHFSPFHSCARDVVCACSTLLFLAYDSSSLIHLPSFCALFSCEIVVNTHSFLPSIKSSAHNVPYIWTTHNFLLTFASCVVYCWRMLMMFTSWLSNVPTSRLFRTLYWNDFFRQPSNKQFSLSGEINLTTQTQLWHTHFINTFSEPHTEQKQTSDNTVRERIINRQITKTTTVQPTHEHFCRRQTSAYFSGAVVVCHMHSSGEQRILACSLQFGTCLCNERKYDWSAQIRRRMCVFHEHWSTSISFSSLAYDNRTHVSLRPLLNENATQWMQFSLFLRHFCLHRQPSCVFLASVPWHTVCQQLWHMQRKGERNLYLPQSFDRHKILENECREVMCHNKHNPQGHFIMDRRTKRAFCSSVVRCSSQEADTTPCLSASASVYFSEFSFKTPVRLDYGIETQSRQRSLSGTSQEVWLFLLLQVYRQNEAFKMLLTISWHKLCATVSKICIPKSSLFSRERVSKTLPQYSLS